MGVEVKEAERFCSLMRDSGRNRDVSRVAVSILKADSKVGQVLERALLEVGLTLPQFNVLMELAANPRGAMPLYDLTARLISTPPNTSWLCTRMQEAGLITKTRAADDSRVVMVTLTEAAWATLERAAPVVIAAEKELLRMYSRTELRQLGRLLAPLVEC